jgi:hypothetical protein
VQCACCPGLLATSPFNHRGQGVCAPCWKRPVTSPVLWQPASVFSVTSSRIPGITWLWMSEVTPMEALSEG